MLRALILKLKASAITPSLGTRRKVWRETTGQEPPPSVIEAWEKNLRRDLIDCRALIVQGWDQFAIGKAFARLFSEQKNGRLEMSLLEAALDVVESPNPLDEMLKPPKG